MLIKDQLIELKWNNSTRKIYEGEKYVYTFEKDVFFVHLDDLTVNSGSKVKIKCDLCSGTFTRVYANYIRTVKKL